MFTSIGSGQLSFKLIDLKRKTTLAAFTNLEASKAVPLGNVVDPQWPLMVVMEIFVGLRLVNLENEQINLRLRAPPGQTEVVNGSNVTLVHKKYP